jgi:hypothetical protein
MSAALVIGCAGEQGSDVVRLPEPVPLATAEPIAAASAEPSASEAPPPASLPPKARPKKIDLDEHPSASDTDRERARELFKQGVTAYEMGDFQKACAAFDVAYQLVPEQPLLFNMASCELRLGHLPKACDLFRKYIANGHPSDPRIVEVSQQVANRCPSR